MGVLDTKARADEPNEVQMEFKTVLVSASGFSGSIQRAMDKTLKKMHKQGWELVNSSYSSGFFSNRTAMIFKRPKKKRWWQ